MQAGWFCELLGKEIGPLSLDQLRALVQRGRLTSDHVVRQGSDGPWIKVGQVPGLSPPDHAPRPTPPSNKPPILPSPVAPGVRRAGAPPIRPRVPPAADLAELINDFDVPAARADHPSDEVALLRAKRRRQQNKFLVATLAAFAVTLLVTAVVLIAVYQQSPPPASQPVAATPTKAADKQPNSADPQTLTGAKPTSAPAADQADKTATKADKAVLGKTENAKDEPAGVVAADDSGDVAADAADNVAPQHELPRKSLPQRDPQADFGISPDAVATPPPGKAASGFFADTASKAEQSAPAGSAAKAEQAAPAGDGIKTDDASGEKAVPADDQSKPQPAKKSPKPKNGRTRTPPKSNGRKKPLDKATKKSNTDPFEDPS